MKIKDIQVVSEGKFLQTYHLRYEKDNYDHKIYEMVSRNRIQMEQDIGNNPSGVALVITVGKKLLLLKEFRMAVNRFVYNLCEGMLERGETPIQCAVRELKEETGLDIVKVKCQLCPCYPAPAFSDVCHYLIFAEAEGELKETMDDEIIIPRLYDKAEIEELLNTERFSATAQMATYFFCKMNE